MYGSDVILRCVHLARKAVKSHAPFFSGRSLRQFSLVHAILKIVVELVSLDLCRFHAEVIMPLQSILFDHPQCIDDVVSMSPRAKGRSLLQQQLNSFFSAIAICDDEPPTEDPGAAVDATEAVKQNVHGLLSNDSCNGLLPQLRADAFPSRQAIFSQCPVLPGKGSRVYVLT